MCLICVVKSQQAGSVLSGASRRRVICVAKNGRSVAVKLLLLKGFKGHQIQLQPSHLADTSLCWNPYGDKYIHLFCYLVLYHSLGGGQDEG